MMPLALSLPNLLTRWEWARWLTETSTEEEFKRALTLGAKIIGVNNRDLHTLTIDMNRIVRLVEEWSRDRIPA